MLHALDNMDDLDNYLDTMMMDQTMSIAKAKKAGDLVAIIMIIKWTSPQAGFFPQIDVDDVARKTMQGMLTFADETNDMTGCVGYLDCTYRLAEAIENTEVPDQVFCMEDNPNHLASP